MRCVISDMVFVFSSSCLPGTARCFDSISSRSDFNFWLIVSISLCKSSSCLLIYSCCQFLGIFNQIIFLKWDVSCNILTSRINKIFQFLMINFFLGLLCLKFELVYVPNVHYWRHTPGRTKCWTVHSKYHITV